MRKYYVDNIRWITVLLVVMYHVIFVFNGIIPEGVIGPIGEFPYLDMFQYILYPWFMVILFIISGMSARFFLEKYSEKEFIRSRTGKLLVPSTIGLFTVHWIQGYLNMYLGKAWEMIPDTMPKPILFLIMSLAGIGPLWFIQVLWILSMLLVVIRKMEKGKLAAFLERTAWHPGLLLFLGVPVWGMAQILNTPLVTAYRFGIYGFTFLSGYYLFSQEQVTNTLKRYCLFFIILSLVSGIIHVRLNFGKNFAVEPVVNSPVTITYLWTICLAIIGVMKKYGNKRNRFCSFMTQKSWGIYVFHYTLILAAGICLTRKTSLSPAATYLFTGMAGFAGSLLVNEIVERIPLIRWCLLGIRNRKEKV